MIRRIINALAERAPATEPERSSIDMVSEFHRALGEDVPAAPTLPTPDEIELRVALVAEEVAEMFDELGAFQMADAMRRARTRIERIPEDINFPRLLKELNDTQYVLDGTYMKFGLGPLKRSSFEEVHRSNMTKTLGARPAPGEKVPKGAGYEPADMEQFFNSKGEE